MSSPAVCQEDDHDEDHNTSLCIIVRPVVRNRYFAAETCGGKRLVTSTKPIRDAARIFLRNGCSPSTMLVVTFKTDGSVETMTLLQAVQDDVVVADADRVSRATPFRPASKPRLPPYQPDPKNGIVANLLDGGTFGYLYSWCCLFVPDEGMPITVGTFAAEDWYEAEVAGWKFARQRNAVFVFTTADERAAALLPPPHDDNNDDDDG